MTTMDPTTARPELSTSDRPRVVGNGSGAAIVELCNGRRTVAEIVAALDTRYRRVRRFLTRLVARRCLEFADG